MSIKPHSVLNFSRPNPEPKLPTTAQALHDAAKHLAQQSLGRPRVKTKDIVGYLLGHGARAWRASFPIAYPRVKAIMPNGHLAVKIRFK
jgi:hypothetical protein